MVVSIIIGLFGSEGRCTLVRCATARRSPQPHGCLLLLVISIATDTQTVIHREDSKALG